MIIPWLSQKIEAIILFAVGILLNFFGRGEPWFPLHALVFGFWIEVMDPCFILSYDPVYLVARQNISWKVRPSPFLVVSQLSGDPPSGNLWHALDISQNCLNWTKAYTHIPSNATQVSPSVAHDTIVHRLGSFIVDCVFWPSRPLIISNALPLNSAAHYFTVL
jgi:hypothetical protein